MIQLDHRLRQNVLKFPVFYLVRHLSILGKDNIISYHFFSQILNISLKFSWR